MRQIKSYKENSAEHNFNDKNILKVLSKFRNSYQNSFTRSFRVLINRESKVYIFGNNSCTLFYDFVFSVVTDLNTGAGN